MKNRDELQKYDLDKIDKTYGIHQKSQKEHIN